MKKLTLLYKIRNNLLCISKKMDTLKELPSWTFPVLSPVGLMELYLKKGPTPGVGTIVTSNAIYILRIETVIVGSWGIVLHSNEASDL